MEHDLIYTLVASLVMAFAFGLIAVKLKLPAIFGYLLAGVIIGPNTPGFVADQSIARQLAEIGVILLMFSVGTNFSFSDLLKTKAIALPGALAQIACATAIGTLAAMFMGYGFSQGLVFGFALSVASTIVLVRSLEQYGMLNSEGGKLAIGWLIVEDIAMVLALVMLPAFIETLQNQVALRPADFLASGGEVLLKIGGFVMLMILVGRWLLPWLLGTIDRLRSSELSTLCTLAVALGFASVAYFVFDASFALGAFLAGVVLNESDIGQKSVKNTLPMRDAFSSIFFVSVGMLFNPAILVEQPLAVLATFLIIVVAKGAAALAITGWFKLKRQAGLIVAVGLAQIGEFSFILGSLALSKNLIDANLYNLILAGAMLSIVVNPLLFRLLESAKGTRWLGRAGV